MQHHLYVATSLTTFTYTCSVLNSVMVNVFGKNLDCGIISLTDELCVILQLPKIESGTHGTNSYNLIETVAHFLLREERMKIKVEMECMIEGLDYILTVTAHAILLINMP